MRQAQFVHERDRRVKINILLEKNFPSFYRLGQKIGEERFGKVPVIVLLLWALWPVYIMVREAIEQPNIDEEFYGIDVAMNAWYQRFWNDSFEVLAKVTIAVAIMCVAIKLSRHGRQTLRYIRGNLWLEMLVALTVWACVCAAASGHFAEEWTGTHYRLDGLRTQFAYAGIVVCVASLPDWRYTRKILDVFVLTANVSAVLVVLQYLDIQAVLNVYPNHCASVYYNINHCAYYLNMSTICLFALYLYAPMGRKKILYLTSMAIQFVALIGNNTFGCFLAVWITVPFIYIMYVKSGRRIDKISLVPLVVITVATILLSEAAINNFRMLFGDMNDVAMQENAEMAGSGRWELWVNAIHRISKRPLFGYGPEGFAFCFPNSKLLDRPHCEFLQYAAFYGIPGMLLYVGALVSLVAKRWKELSSLDDNILVAGCAVFAYVVSSCFGNTMFYTSPYFFMILGIVALENNSKKALQ